MNPSRDALDREAVARTLTVQQLLELALTKLRAESPDDSTPPAGVSFSVPLVPGARS